MSDNYLSNECSCNVSKDEAVVEVFLEGFHRDDGLRIAEVVQVTDETTVIVIKHLVQVFDAHLGAGAGAKEVCLKMNRWKEDMI